MQSGGTKRAAEAQHHQGEAQSPNRAELRDASGPTVRHQHQAECQQNEGTQHQPQPQAVARLARGKPYQGREIQPAEKPQESRQQDRTDRFVTLFATDVQIARQLERRQRQKRDQGPCQVCNPSGGVEDGKQ